MSKCRIYTTNQRFPRLRPPPRPAEGRSVSIDLAEARVTEGNASQEEISLNVSLNAPYHIPVSVNYKTQDGTGKAGTDYAAQSGTLTFSPGQTSKAIKINVTGDSYLESAETFSIVLSSPVNARISRATSTVTIINDDRGICAVTAQIRNEILRQLSGVSDCADVTDAHLRGIRHIDVHQSRITSLQSHDFNGLVNLIELQLYLNNLSSLPPNVFADLTNLTDLGLRDNELSSLPPGAFAGLTRLNRLNIGLNRLSSLPPGVFDGLTSLTELSINQNGLLSLPPDAFAGLTSMRQLELHGNSLSSLPPNAFAGLTSMRQLGLHINNLSSLPPGIFDDMTGLTWLGLAGGGNRNLRLNSGIFAKTTQITHILLSHSTNSNLPDGIFANLTNSSPVVEEWPDDW